MNRFAQMLDHETDDAALDRLFRAENWLSFHDTFVPPERRALETRFLEKNLDLGRDLSLLDLACGHGRHANLLAPGVQNIVAIDRNAALLEVARAEAQSLGIENVDYRSGDIREIDFIEQFDRAILVNTVFGLFSDVQNADILNRIRESLSPRGRLCLDIINRDTVFVDFRPHGITELHGDFLLDRLDFDARSGRMTNRRIYLRSGVAEDASFSLRLYNLSETHTILDNAGFAILSLHADWHGSAFVANSKKMIIVAEKMR